MNCKTHETTKNEVFKNKMIKTGAKIFVIAMNIKGTNIFFNALMEPYYLKSPI